MNLRQLVLLCTVLVGSIVSGGQSRVDKTPVISVNRPTVVAFWKFDQTKDAAVVEDNEALSDFQFYSRTEKELFRKQGINFQEVYAPSFRLRTGNKIMVVHPGQFKGGVGYYLIAPGRKPRIVNGVMADSDLLEVAEGYFLLKKK